MTLDEAKAIVLAKYPHAFCKMQACARVRKFIVRKDFSYARACLSGEHRTEEAAWLRAAKTVSEEAS